MKDCSRDGRSAGVYLRIDVERTATHDRFLSRAHASNACPSLHLSQTQPRLHHLSSYSPTEQIPEGFDVEAFVPGALIVRAVARKETHTSCELAPSVTCRSSPFNTLGGFHADTLGVFMQL